MVFISVNVSIYVGRVCSCLAASFVLLYVLAFLDCKLSGAGLCRSHVFVASSPRKSRSPLSPWVIAGKRVCLLLFDRVQCHGKESQAVGRVFSQQGSF